jgi:hypothetical protein
MRLLKNEITIKYLVILIIIHHPKTVGYLDTHFSTALLAKLAGLATEKNIIHDIIISNIMHS